MATRMIRSAPDGVPTATFGRFSVLPTPFLPVTWFAVGEYVLFVTNAPVGITGTHTAKIKFIMASATSNQIAWRVEVQAVTPGDSFDIDAGTSFDTANNSSDTAAPGTAGYLAETSITLSNMDGIAAGDYVVFKVSRVTASGTAATGDAGLLTFEWQDGA